MSEWKKYRLSDAIEIIGGGTPKRSVSEYWNGNIPWLSVVDFNNGARFVSDTTEKITESGLKNSSTKLLDKGQLIISARGTVGCLAQLAKPMAFNQSCYGLTGKQEIIENDFLYYLVKNNITQFKQNVHGAVFDTITKETFNHIPVEIPTIPYQNKIAKILGDLDNKIAINQQINKTLEGMAQAVFKSWFVDFEPVKAKAAAIAAGGNAEDANLAAMQAISGKTPEELATLKTTNPHAHAELLATANLFPHTLTPSALGDIPEGWEVSCIENEFNVVMGQSPSGSSYNESKTGTLFFQGRAEFGWRFPEPRLHTTEPKRLAKKGNVLMSVRAPVGDLNIALDDCCVGRGLAAIIHKSNSTSYTYYLLNELKPTLDRYNGEGTVFGSINQKDFKSIAIVAPSKSIVDNFISKISNFDAEIENLSLQSQTLTQIRDSLLPKLLSGEIDISNLNLEGVV